MKKFVGIAFVMLVFAAGCAKKEMGCTPVSPQSEEAQIKAFAAANSIKAVKDGNGIYYEIIDTGSGKKPTINSTVSATYTGKLLNGTKFDEALTPVDFPLSGVIEGWGIAIPLIAKGGRIKLIIPSSYGYGCIDKRDRAGNIVIPANSVLYFDVTLIEVK